MVHYRYPEMDSDLLTLTSNAATAVVDIEAGGRIASLIVDGVELLVPREDDPVAWLSLIHI